MENPKRRHVATYSRDKYKGGWNVRVSGPYPEKFAGREVPVVTRKGDETMELLDALLWSGVDKETQEPVALYSFIPRPKDEDVALEF